MLKVPQRRSIRLKSYDYSSHGAYFLTICTHKRQCTLGAIEDENMVLSGLGEIVKKEWFNLTIYYPSILLDEFIIMPNHIHGIIFIENTCAKKLTLGTIMKYFKSITTIKNNKFLKNTGKFFWQRNYYE
jgi:REP element-mobilizing transposase RayT